MNAKQRSSKFEGGDVTKIDENVLVISIEGLLYHFAYRKKFRKKIIGSGR